MASTSIKQEQQLLPSGNDPKDVSSASRGSPTHALRNIRDPQPHDVLCGRGGGTNNHPGNEHFRDLVNDRKVKYLNSSKREKPLVSRSIVEAVRKLDPPGRFLQKDEKSGLWYDIGDQKAREKTSQALREGAPVIRREISMGGSGAAAAAGGRGDSSAGGGGGVGGVVRLVSSASADRQGHVHPGAPPPGVMYHPPQPHPAAQGANEQIQIERHMRNVALAEAAMREQAVGGAKVVSEEAQTRGRGAPLHNRGSKSPTRGASGTSPARRLTPKSRQQSQQQQVKQVVVAPPNEEESKQLFMRIHEHARSAHIPYNQAVSVQQVQALRSQGQQATIMRNLSIPEPPPPQPVVGMGQAPSVHLAQQQQQHAAQYGTVLSPSFAGAGISPVQQQQQMNGLTSFSAADPAVAQWLAGNASRQQAQQRGGNRPSGAPAVEQPHLYQVQPAAGAPHGGGIQPPNVQAMDGVAKRDRATSDQQQKTPTQTSNKRPKPSFVDENTVTPPPMSEDTKRRLVQAEYTSRSVADGTANSDLMAAERDAALYQDAGILGIDPDEVTEQAAGVSGGGSLAEILECYYRKLSEDDGSEHGGGGAEIDLFQKPTSGVEEDVSNGPEGEKALPEKVGDVATKHVAAQEEPKEESEQRTVATTENGDKEDKKDTQTSKMETDDTAAPDSKSSAKEETASKEETPEEVTSKDDDVAKKETKTAEMDVEEKESDESDATLDLEGQGTTKDTTSGKKRNRSSPTALSRKKQMKEGLRESDEVVIFDVHRKATATCRRIEAALLCIDAM